MDDDKALKIKQLAVIEFDKRERYRTLGMINTQNEEAEKRQRAIDCAIARGEWFEAKRALDDELKDLE